tara:strand:+ start:21657 stop:23009 length:1353 start_codon:yes stop_codon:yes gene_type:complete
MRIHPPALEIGDHEGFNPEKDLFGRAHLGNSLTNLVSKIEEPLVIALDGQWGSGKTTFLKMWAGELRNAGFPVVHLDAFENDYVDDAFAALARQILKVSEANNTIQREALEVFRTQTLALGKQLLRSGLKIGASAGIKIITAGVLDGKDLEALREAVIEGTSEAANGYLDELLSRPNEQHDAAVAFRQALQDLPAKLSPPVEGNAQLPLIYIIDELDRCKPIFALEVIERIKHFLSVPNVHFVFGVNMKQLEQSVCFAYGSGVDAATYLQKFINLTVLNVDNSEHRHESDIRRYIEYLGTALEIPSTRNMQLATEFIERVSHANKYSFRTLEHIFASLAIASATGDLSRNVIGPILGGLCILKVTRSDLFSKSKTRELRFQDVSEVFAFEQPVSEPNSHDTEWQKKWWRICTEDQLTNDLSELERSDVFIEVDRLYYVSYIANEIVDRFG